MIKNSLANTPQITFEVTDLCNLDCVYCGYGKLYSDHDERTNKNWSLLKLNYSWITYQYYGTRH